MLIQPKYSRKLVHRLTKNNLTYYDESIYKKSDEY